MRVEVHEGIHVNVSPSPAALRGDETVRMEAERPVWVFETVYRSEYAGLVAVATAITGDRDGAADLVQDTMVKAFVRWSRISVMERPGAWCHHVLVNACRSRLRRRATERRFVASFNRREPVTQPPSDDVIAFWSVVRTLPERPRSVVALYFAGGMTSVEIATVLGVPEGTVRSDLATARRVVMRAMRGENDD